MFLIGLPSVIPFLDLEGLYRVGVSSTLSPDIQARIARWSARLCGKQKTAFRIHPPPNCLPFLDTNWYRKPSHHFEHAWEDETKRFLFMMSTFPSQRPGRFLSNRTVGYTVYLHTVPLPDEEEVPKSHPFKAMLFTIGGAYNSTLEDDMYLTLQLEYLRIQL